jgi:methyl-accepting chemotaxis protein
MQTTRKRQPFGRGKGYLNAAVPQSRFIIFLLLILGAYTFLLRVFQKLAESVQFPVFFLIALITLMFFIGIAGTLYSHTFVGPLLRIRRTLEHLADGDVNVSLRLRDSDDPTLKALVTSITRLCEQSRKTHTQLQDAARDLIADIEELREKAWHGADRADLQKHIDGLRAKQDLLEKAINAGGKR